MPSTELAWYNEWSKRTSCWIQRMSVSAQQQLGSCSTALGLQLGQQFEQVLSAAGKATPLTAAGAKAEAGCDWLQQGAALLKGMPALPSVVGDFEFMLPPMPNLTPWGVKKWQQMGQDDREREQASNASLCACSFLAAATCCQCKCAHFVGTTEFQSSGRHSG